MSSSICSSNRIYSLKWILVMNFAIIFEFSFLYLVELWLRHHVCTWYYELLSPSESPRLEWIESTNRTNEHKINLYSFHLAAHFSIDWPMRVVFLYIFSQHPDQASRSHHICHWSQDMWRMEHCPRLDMSANLDNEPL